MQNSEVFCKTVSKMRCHYIFLVLANLQVLLYVHVFTLFYGHECQASEHRIWTDRVEFCHSSASRPGQVTDSASVITSPIANSNTNSLGFVKFKYVCHVTLDLKR